MSKPVVSHFRGKAAETQPKFGPIRDEIQPN